MSGQSFLDDGRTPKLDLSVLLQEAGVGSPPPSSPEGETLDDGRTPALDLSALFEEKEPGGDAPSRRLSPGLALEMNAGRSPEQAAEQKRLARATGLPLEVVRDDVDKARRLVELDQLRTASDPFIPEWLRDEYNAAISSDDIANLAAARELLSGKSVFAEHYAQGSRQLELTNLIRREFEGESSPELKEQIQALRREIQESAPQEPEGLLDQFVANTGEQLPVELVLRMEAAKGYAVGGMMGAAGGAVAGGIGAPAGAALMAKAGGVVYVMSAAYDLETLSAFDTYRNEGVDEDSARWAARVYGLLASGIEGTSELVTGIPALLGISQEASKQARRTAKATVRNAIGNFFLNTLKVKGAESLEEGLQQGVQIAVGEAVKELTGVDSAFSWDEAAGEVVEAAWKTFWSAVGTDRPVPRLALDLHAASQHKALRELHKDFLAANAAGHHAAFMENAVALAGQSKTRERDADAFEEFVRESLPESAVRQYIDAETARTFFQSVEGGEGLLERLGIDEMEFAQALENGGVVGMDTAGFLAHLHPEQQWQLLPDLRAEPLALSQREAASRDFAAEAGRAAREYAPDMERAEAYAAERDRLVEELVAAGREKGLAETEADLFLAKSVAWEKSYGFDGVEEMRRRTVRRGEEGEALPGAFAQPVNPDVDLDAPVTVVRAEPRFAGRQAWELTKGAVPKELKKLAGFYRNEETGWNIRLDNLGKRIQRIAKSKSLDNQMRDQVLALADRFQIGTDRKSVV